QVQLSAWPAANLRMTASSVGHVPMGTPPPCVLCPARFSHGHARTNLRPEPLLSALLGRRLLRAGGFLEHERLLLRVDHPALLLYAWPGAHAHGLGVLEGQLLPEEEEAPRAGARHRLELLGVEHDARRAAFERTPQITLERGRDRLVELARDDDRGGAVGDL